MALKTKHCCEPPEELIALIFSASELRRHDSGPGSADNYLLQDDTILC